MQSTRQREAQFGNDALVTSRRGEDNQRRGEKRWAMRGEEVDNERRGEKEAFRAEKPHSMTSYIERIVRGGGCSSGSVQGPWGQFPVNSEMGWMLSLSEPLNEPLTVG